MLKNLSLHIFSFKKCFFCFFDKIFQIMLRHSNLHKIMFLSCVFTTLMYESHYATNHITQLCFLDHLLFSLHLFYKFLSKRKCYVNFLCPFSFIITNRSNSVNIRPHLNPYFHPPSPYGSPNLHNIPLCIKLCIHI